MFERYLTDLLTTYFGRYVIMNMDNQSCCQLRVSAWNGAVVVLQDVDLRHDCLRHFLKTKKNNKNDANPSTDDDGEVSSEEETYPFEIAHGRVGRLELRIPWKVIRSLLSSSSTTTTASLSSSEMSSNNNHNLIYAVISDVNILITPHRRKKRKRRRQQTQTTTTSKEESAATTDDHDEQQETQQQDEEDQQREQSTQACMDAELLRRILNMTPSRSSSTTAAAESSSTTTKSAATKTTSSSSSSSWKSRLQQRLKSLLVSHLSVTIQNIHIRYEDPGTCLGFQWNDVFDPNCTGDENDDEDEPTTKPQEQQPWDESFVSCYSSTQQQPYHSSDQPPIYNDRQTYRSDHVTRYRPRFAVGLTLQKFSIQSGGALPTTRDESLHQKTASAQQLAVYWDSDTPMIATSVSSKSEFESAFARLSSDVASNTQTFVLDPISPSLQLTLLTDIPSTTSNLVLCNSLDVAIPPCRFTLARSLLEDLSYLRKSMDVYISATKGWHLSDEVLQRLTHLRPQQQSNKDFRGWWKYAYAAVLAVLQKSTTTTTTRNSSPSSEQQQPLRRGRFRGWVGLAQALGRRRRYSLLYKSFLLSVDPVERQSTHDNLLVLERSLLIQEIVAFRISTFHDMWSDVDQGIVGPSDRLYELMMATDAAAVQKGDFLLEDSSSALSASADDVSSSNVLSVENRSQMFIEMAIALHRERRNNNNLQRNGTNVMMSGTEIAPKTDDHTPVETKLLVTWKLSLKCTEFSLQVNDCDETTQPSYGVDLRLVNTAVPVVRLSCAFAQELDLYVDGSWLMTTRVGSLSVQDLTTKSVANSPSASRSPRRRDRRNSFPNLVALKKSYSETTTRDDENTFSLDGIVHDQNIWVRVQRTKWSSGDQLGSTTSTKIRVLPLEIVYSTVPLESVSHVFNAANVDFTNDYNRIASRLSAWRVRQQTRLLHALAHKQKKIYVDVVIGAPVLLLPDDEGRIDRPLLLVDLGQLRFANNISGVGGRNDEDFDDKWRLDVSDIQVNATYAHTHVTNGTVVEGESPMAVQVIEPFSVAFDISTKIPTETSVVADEHTHIRVLANLPRLVFNLSSSALHLMCNLRNEWEMRRKERQPLDLRARLGLGRRLDLSQPRSGTTTKRSDAAVSQGRRIEFQFVAPLFCIKFENDSIGNAGMPVSTQMPKKLLEFMLKGIEGNYLRESLADEVSSSFNAKVRALAVVDLYQKAGPPFSLILSSISPDLATGNSTINMKAFDNTVLGNELVNFAYKSHDRLSDDLNLNEAERPNTLSIQFHELFVEWNPETFAAVSAAIYSSSKDSQGSPDSLESRLDDEDFVFIDHDQTVDAQDDEFYDADEEAFYDAESVASGEHCSPMLSEISESDRSTSTALITSREGSGLVTLSGMKPSVSRLFSPSAVPGSPWIGKIQQSSTRRTSEIATTRIKPFEITFILSRLRVNFNRESRHRRLITADMEGTTIRRETLESGGSKTVFTIGNLTFTDCESASNKTLYREILGLKTDGRAGNVSSLLEMTMISKPRQRCYASLAGTLDDPAAAVQSPVSVDYELGSVHGFDNYLEARFSPMRFVYLQQLWFEIIDYFFVGIVGYEVWGGKTPSPKDVTILEGNSISADEISFTRFDVLMESPVILFPVSSCSTDYIRLAASRISFRNQYKSSDLRSPGFYFRGDGLNRQWYNTCFVEVSSMALHSWSGAPLNASGNFPTSHISLSWPVGPSAPINIPKWKVDCELDATYLVLDKPGYSLLQHIVQFNIGDESHHLEEWYALNSLGREAQVRHEQVILVHFGYDKKDATPTTFDVTVTAPKLDFEVQRGDSQSIAVMHCSNLCWTYEKLADRVSKQKVMCDLEVVSSVRELTILSLNAVDPEKPSATDRPHLAYSTSTDPSGDNNRTLEIFDTAILFDIPAWQSLRTFFQNLPAPRYLSPAEAIQVGDRWYRIGEQTFRPAQDDPNLNLRWIDEYGLLKPDWRTERALKLNSISYSFRFALWRSGIRFGRDTSIVLSIEAVDFIRSGRADLVNQTINVSGIEVQTRSVDQGRRSSDFSLIRPWNVNGSIQTCTSGRQCECECHSYQVTADTLYARVSFSDMTVAVDTAMQLVRDINSASHALQTSTMASFDTLEQGDGVDYDRQTKLQVWRVEWEGIHLTIADDSGRHFVGDQELCTAYFQKVNFLREEKHSADHLNADKGTKSYSMRLQVEGVDVYDNLQLVTSPFRRVLAVHPNSLGFEPVRHNALRHDTEQRCSVSKPSKTSDADSAIEIWSESADTKVCGLSFRCIETQYNPSFVVAIQRFIGRFLKAIKRKHAGILDQNHGKNDPKSKLDLLDQKGRPSALVHASFDVEHISICLNKEHQNRRLLEASIAGVHVSVDWTDRCSDMQGHLGEIRAYDPELNSDGIHQEIIRSSAGVGSFFKFRYRAFFKHSEGSDIYHGIDDIPDWVEVMLGDSSTVDDILDISITTLEAAYLRGRTSELIDYLGNGMPGRGMGATSRAAQGFVSDRIQRKSFFNLHIDAPRLIVPQGPGISTGMLVRLGDLSVKSWIEDEKPCGPARYLTVLLTGFSLGVFGESHSSSSAKIQEKPIASEIDVSLRIEIGRSTVSVSCSLSDLRVHLSYSAYITLLRVLRNNVAKKADTDRWDNVEKDWDNQATEGRADENGILHANDLIYSASARLVRYGPRSAPKGQKTAMDLSITFGSMSFVLRRDDVEGEITNHYDMLMLYIQDFDFGMGRKNDGDEWLSLTLRKIFVFDLGKVGRYTRESGGKRCDHEGSNSISVLVEGYSPPERGPTVDDGSEFETQIVVKIDREQATSGSVKAVVVVSYLSFTAFVGPFRDLVHFFSCTWPLSASSKSDDFAVATPLEATDKPAIKSESSITNSMRKDNLQVRFVSHYPRLVFASDESDPNSRALVIRGLSIANASFEQEVSGNDDSEATEHGLVSQLSVHADFQNVSSHIHPDIANIVSLRGLHFHILESEVSFSSTAHSRANPDSTDIGVPLLLPLTVSVEFEQNVFHDEPKKRIVSISVDPLSIMLSNEDIIVVRAVLGAWIAAAKPITTVEAQRPFLYEVIFQSQRLGLGLRKENGKIAVDHVAASTTSKNICIGDTVHAINGTLIENAEMVTLTEIVNRLAAESRPLRVTFARLCTGNGVASDTTDFDAQTNKELGVADKMEVSLSSAIVTLVEKELPLFRGSLTTAKVVCRVDQSTKKEYSLDISTALCVEYYNLRIWGFEPCVEPGVMYLTSSLQECARGQRELAMEIGDCDCGLSVNVTDSLIETLSKLLQWRDGDTELTTTLMLGNEEAAVGVSLSSKDRRDLISRHAANEAYRFAAKQKAGTSKPFIFRNRTGLSVAFVKQSLSKDMKPTVEGNSTFIVGEYSGLNCYDPSTILVAGNNEEIMFQAAVNSAIKGPNGHDAALFDVFPRLTVAIQAANGIAADPFVDLQISRPGEMLLPLKHPKLPTQEYGASREWVTWLVEHQDEKTVITMGSSIRVVSFLHQPLELRIDACREDLNSKLPHKAAHVVSLHAGIPYCLPLWISMYELTWKCSLRITTEHRFTPLFNVSTDGSIALEETSTGSIECRRELDGTSAWLSVSQLEERGITTIGIDCAVSVRNLLPLSIDWELTESTTDGDRLRDGSTAREVAMGKAQPLQSGEQAEILSNGWNGSKIRIRPASVNCGWSSWTPVSLVRVMNSKNNSKVEAFDESTVVLYVEDASNVPLPLGLRICRKSSGVEVSVFAELWCSNCTSLDILFGWQQPAASKEENSVSEKDVRSKEMSVAEATLKEISSLFEPGETGTNGSQQGSQTVAFDVVRLPGQVIPVITEETFEYLEIDDGTEFRRWWASENPFFIREDIATMSRHVFVEIKWEMDKSGKTLDGWESSPILYPFSSRREFKSYHRYRRRRWTCTRPGLPNGTMVDGVNACFQSVPSSDARKLRDKKGDQIGMQVGLQVGGGRWSITSMLPRHGTVHGVIRATKSRWPETVDRHESSRESAMFELNYTVSPLDGDWGLLSRCMYVSSRFLLRNDSETIAFEAKQTGTVDSTAVIVRPGHTEPFHWGHLRLPELISIRPTVKNKGRSFYRWSGGFDPLTIGPVPIRIRKVTGLVPETINREEFSMHAVKMEVEIRPRTGGTGINLTFREEDTTGAGSLYRIDNLSPFPIWLCQDDLLANPSRMSAEEDQGDRLDPFETSVFALDVPYKQGKYANRKSASLAVLLRTRLALAPLNTRAGIETTKVVSLANSGETVRLNPSKLMILDGSIRRALEDVRIVGFINNDGPTRVLTLRLMRKTVDYTQWNALSSSYVPATSPGLPVFANSVLEGALHAIEQRRVKAIPTEQDVIDSIVMSREKNVLRTDIESISLNEDSRSLLVSFRAAFTSLVVSLVDSAPSEIAVASFRNMNAIATWDTQRVSDSTVYITVTSVQVDNMLPNAPFPVAVCPFDLLRAGRTDAPGTPEDTAPLLVIGLSFAPRHKSKILCLKSATIAPRNLAINVDLAFLVRLQKFILELQEHFHLDETDYDGTMQVPDIQRHIADLLAAAESGLGRQKIYFAGLTILPCNIKLSVAPARALTPEQAALEGAEAAAIHQAVRKGDILLDSKRVGILGVKVGSRNKTPLAVIRGMLKSFVVDGLLRLDGASLNFAGVALRNYTSTGSQLTTALSAHYMAALRQNLPALLGSMAAFGNPLGLVRGLGEGVGDFVLEPVRGFQRSVQEMDASYLVDGVARGTLSLARHTVGGFADSAAMLAETFSKNMTVLTLDRRYAQKRDRGDMLRDYNDINVASGLGSGVQKLVNGFLEGVTGVVRAPIRGAEKKGFEGFAKGVGKGLLGLLVKPIIGISDGFTDVMMGVKGSVDGVSGQTSLTAAAMVPVRPRRALYGRERAIRTYHSADAAACALMLRTRLAGEAYLSHLDMGDRVALITVRRVVILGVHRGEELLVLKLNHVASLEVRSIHGNNNDNKNEWAIIVVLSTPRSNGSEVEVISCPDKSFADQLCSQLEYGRIVASTE